MQVRPVENPPEDVIKARVVGIKQSLIGYSVRHEPHPQEEEEEEDILHLNRKRDFSGVTSQTSFRTLIMVDDSHHLPNNYDFWSQLFVNSKDVDETEGEHHVIQAEKVPSKFV